MKISAELADGLRWLADIEEWGPEDKAEAKRCLKADPGFFCHFFAVWIEAKRKGYKFFDGTRYVRLAGFCAENGLPDPYQGQFTDAQVDGDAA